jgi:lysophospholipase L1-like esterase
MKKYFILSVILNVFLLVILAVNFKGKANDAQVNPGPGTSRAEAQKPQNPTPVQSGTSTFSPLWHHRYSLFQKLPNRKNEIVFLGNSITNYCEWAELFQNSLVINRGIGGDITEGILARLHEVTESKPRKIFLMIGVNDLAKGKPIKGIATNYRSIIKAIKENSPETTLYIESVLPSVNRPGVINDSIVALNKEIRKLSNEYSLTYINLYDSFKDQDGNLKKELTEDGLHLKGEGYLIWKSLIEKYVNN